MASKRLRTVLVGIAEPHARSQPALERAAELAQAFRAELIVFHSAYDSQLSGGRLLEVKRLAQARGKLVAERRGALERLCERLERRDIRTRCVVVWEEPAYAALIRAAIRDNVDFIVVGVHRFSERRAMLKQNDWELMRYSSRPVLIVRKASRRAGAVVAALDPTHANDKPAALDVEIAKNAVLLAAGLNTELHVAHCIPDSAYPLGPITAKDRHRMKSIRQKEVRTVLHKAGADVHEIHLVDGLVEVALPKLLRSLNAGTLVLGALSRRWLKGFIIGNTAERLIDDTDCDLLIVKPPGFKTRLPRARKEPIELPR